MSDAIHRYPRHASIVMMALLLAACSMMETRETVKSTAPKPVTGVTWEWVGTTTPEHQVAVAKPSRYTVRLKQNGEAQLRYDCNHGGAFYRISDGKLAFGPLTATRIPCPADSYERLYMDQLNAVDSFFTEDGYLYMEFATEAGTMQFRRAGTR